MSKEEAAVTVASSTQRSSVSPAEKVETVVNEWFNEHVRNSAIARETQAYNAALAAAEALKKMLLARLF